MIGASLFPSIRESWRRNEYWLSSVLSQAQEQPQYLDHSHNRQADYESITAADLRNLAAEYLAPEHAAQFVVKPAKHGPTGRAPPLAAV